MNFFIKLNTHIHKTSDYKRKFRCFQLEQEITILVHIEPDSELHNLVLVPVLPDLEIDFCRFK
jgi:hypothetical protein